MVRGGGVVREGSGRERVVTRTLFLSLGSMEDSHI